MWLDSDRFVFLREGNRLVVANADGSGQRELLRVNALIDRTTPCVAPDGSGVAVPVSPAGAGPEMGLLIVSIDAAVPPLRIPAGDIWGEGPGCSWQALRP